MASTPIVKIRDGRWRRAWAGCRQHVGGDFPPCWQIRSYQAESPMRIIEQHPQNAGQFDENAEMILVINPNSTEAFTTSMRDHLRSPYLIEYYTAPEDAPASIEGSFDSVVSAAACLRELEVEVLGRRWAAIIVACFSFHPLISALRELTTAPVVSIFTAPLQVASNLGSHVGILTTSPRWVPLLQHDLAAAHMTSLCSGGVVLSGMSVLDLEDLPQETVRDRLSDRAREMVARGVDVIVLGCAGMVGLDRDLSAACGVPVIDPVAAALQTAHGLLALGLSTSKRGIYADA